MKYIRSKRDIITPLEHINGIKEISITLQYTISSLAKSYHVCHIRHLEFEINHVLYNSLGIDTDLYVESLKLQLSFYKRKYPEEFI